MTSFQKLLDFLARLEEAKIHFALASIRSETIAVLIAVPGERWEVEFFADGVIEVEVFSSVQRSNVLLEGEEALERLFATHSTLVGDHDPPSNER